MPDPINIAKFNVGLRPDGTIGIELPEALTMDGHHSPRQGWLSLSSLADAETLRDALSALITLERSRRQRQSASGMIHDEGSDGAASEGVSGGAR